MNNVSLSSTPDRAPNSAAAMQTSQRSKGYYGARRVRRSLKHYIVGRGITAFAGFGVALLLVRELSIIDYASYTTLSGLLLSLMVLSNGGLERVVPRYFPDLRQAGAEAELRRFCWRLTWIRFALLAMVLAPMALCYPWLAAQFSLAPDAELMWAFILYSFAFGMSQHASNCLQALLLQREATTGNAVEWLSKFLVLGGWWYINRGSLTLTAAVWIQGITATLGLLFMLWQLRTHLRNRQNEEQPTTRVLQARQVLRMGWYNYLQALAGFHANPATSKLVSAYFLGAPATASLGFAHSFTQFLRRNLPAKLFLGLIEPAIMARYSENRSFNQTAHLTGIVLKTNLFILMPITAWMSLNGRSIIEFITNGKYGDSVWLIGCFMLVLIMESHRVILQLISNAIERSELLLHSNILSMIFVPISLVATLRFGLPGLAACVLAISFSRNVYLVRGLRRLGYAYAPDWSGIARIVVAAMIGAGIGRLALAMMHIDLRASIVSMLLAGVVYFAIAWAWKPFSKAERETVNQFIGKRYFFF